jgi:putative spermidine/putrescine transport system permease protein
VTAALPTTPAPAAPSGRRRGGASLRLLLPTLPFFAYVALFLVLPTAIVVIGAFQTTTGGFTVANLSVLTDPAVRSAALWSIGLSAISAVTGAILGGLLAYAISTANPLGLLRRTVVAGCSVLAQFGGVMLAFAFIATFGATGSITTLIRSWTGVRVDSSWIYDFRGLLLIYAYFQIPLMVIVFLPALDGIRSQWREATETLGGSTWIYWRRVAGPILAPAFLSSTLLLFANAFSAYATAAALISQENPLLALQIRGFLTSEVVQGSTHAAQVVALLMVVIVAVVMAIYAVLQRRAARWLG